MTQVTEEMLSAYEKGMAAANNSTVDAVRCAGIQALFDQGLISLPVGEAAIRESVVREAIALFDDKNAGWNGAGVQKRLQSLLLTKDRVEELAKEYVKDGKWLVSATQGRDLPNALADAFRWLIEREG